MKAQVDIFEIINVPVRWQEVPQAGYESREDIIDALLTNW
jgi:hypothetical protein